ncbi:peroxisomal carnitine O-octanoyltransferase [Octopus bimaculoides]|uniref:Peroxisomal carnitine O-octanoyltransferase n=1 Tax=Octopus bimaculoides TaxID=37653 RepID=A0A0L8GCL3_OCTBM|nr:peroxisomal carnitine O-octanoyltransferase [Octopus bimaculoides]XP_052826784.1 peroxisomal carnitine O-octanoyltransferase [Octopus bimaculoides]XP_052826785.1 peroxisomal carnitine O-octanoyltransferase [Octopus bimaculoides]|eukprot:XP_014782147.1 PREDICTED: peroxisomal carnitine O-octanoyltransferase-like [Octopus bimaculoides]
MSATILQITSTEEKTFQNQDALPPLPCPDLSKTLQKYLDSVRPHVSDEEYQQTTEIVQEFASNAGARLHRLLEEKAKNENNWLEKWWEDLAYLETRSPCAPMINTGGEGPYYRHYWPAKVGTQIERCAMCLYYTLEFWQFLRRETLRSQTNRNGQSLCMNQYHTIFTTCRIPGTKKDHLLYYFKTESEGETPRHILVLCHGRMFTMGITDDTDELITAPEMQKQLQIIYDKCIKEAVGPSVGILTAHDRTSWAKYYKELLAIHPGNFQTLELIQKSVMTVSLDEDCPQDTSELFQKAIAGDPTNRWFDKSINLISFKNGLFGSNLDHSPSDGMTTVHMTYYVDCRVKESKGKWTGNMTVRDLEPPKEITLHLNESIYQGIEDARKIYLNTAKTVKCNILWYDKYGRTFLRSFNLHPDTHVQLALQYVYYRLNGKPAPTYETATIRVFWHGRTETIRSCSMEAVKWCQAMLDPKVSKAEKLNLMLAAAQKHNTLRSEAQNLEGCDRHLLALYVLARDNGEDIPAIFTDPAFIKSGGGGNFYLSTSFLGYTTAQGGTLPMVKDGYGIFYHIEEGLIYVFASSFKDSDSTDCEKFNSLLTEVFNEMKDLLEIHTKVAHL